MDQPLFGEEERKWKILSWAAIVVVVGMVAVSILSLIIKGAMNGIPQHYFAAALVGLVFAMLVVLWRWYQQGDLDPKFKWLLIMAVVATLYACVDGLIYAFKPVPVIPGMDCFQSNGFWDNNTQNCIYIMNFANCTRFSHGQMCITMSSYTNGFCHNCTDFFDTPHPHMADSHNQLFIKKQEP